jgi:SAM-dependent methyltransferase
MAEWDSAAALRRKLAAQKDARRRKPPVMCVRSGGLYKRIMAHFLAASSAAYDASLAARKQALFGGLTGDVLEIGPGGGPNLRFFSPAVRWVGVEPNPYLHDYLRAEAARQGRQVDLRLGSVDALPAADTSLDAVVSTLVLCSVPDQHRALAEIRRVLKPGGRFVFIEHVAAPRGTTLRRWQNLVRPIWQALGDGCQPNRETWQAIADAGFARVHLDHFDTQLPLVKPHIAGYAVN